MRIGIDLRSNRLTLCLLVFACFASVTGCNAVVNFDDYQFHPGDDPKAGSDGGSGGKGGKGGGGGKPSEDKDSSTPDDKDASTSDSGPDEPMDGGMDSGPGGNQDSGPGGNQDSGMSCESNTEDCNNDLDDDCDHLRDCKDPDCAGNQVCCVPNQIPETSCSGGIDNDCDGDIDCADTDCAASPMCCTASGAEVGVAACSDGLDNDCDGLTDCQETVACAEAGGAACSDGLDNDCDGLEDCQESACAAQASCCNATGAENSAGVCGDSIDNDCDGLKDCLDPECATTNGCCTATASTETSCNNNADEDCDGNVDCRDSDCASTSPCVSCVKNPPGALTETNCGDRIDNDCDLDKDCLDPDCAGQVACCVPNGAENTATACVDNVDNDCDGVTDCADPECAGQLSCCVSSPENTASACGDLIDNDCDGMKDCADTNCTGIGSCCVMSGTENNMTACNDLVDNDCDGKNDCADPDCTGIGSCCSATTSGGDTTTLGAGSCCVPDGMAEAAAPNDGKDNDCDGLRDIPVLMQAFPTQGLPSSADEVKLKFMTEIAAGASLYCRTHRPMDTTALWSPCPMSGTEVKPFTASASQKPENNGLWVTDVRWNFSDGATSDVHTFRYYVHNTLHGVPHCGQPHSDAQWFMKAAERLASPDAGTFKLGADTFLASPFIKVTYKIPQDSWPDWQLDGTLKPRKMPSLRRRFTLSGDGKYLLITRNYQSTRSGGCWAATIRVHNTQMMSGPRNNNRFNINKCRAIVLNRAGAGVCLIEGGTGPNFVANSDSNEVFANSLGWTKANKFMWRILLESRKGGFMNFTNKCETMPCANGIYLPDRASFPQ